MTDPLVVLAFYSLAGLLVGSALAVVLLPRIVHAALMLVVFFIGTAGLFVLLQAEFLAAVQVLIYAGAITVLILFAIMLTQQAQAPGSNAFNRQRLLAAPVAAGVLGALVGGLGGTAWPAPPPVAEDLTPRLGSLLLREYLVPFEVASVLLLVALVGAIVVARER